MSSRTPKPSHSSAISAAAGAARRVEGGSRPLPAARGGETPSPDAGVPPGPPLRTLARSSKQRRGRGLPGTSCRVGPEPREPVRAAPGTAPSSRHRAGPGRRTARVRQSRSAVPRPGSLPPPRPQRLPAAFRLVARGAERRVPARAPRNPGTRAGPRGPRDAPRQRAAARAGGRGAGVSSGEFDASYSRERCLSPSRSCAGVENAIRRPGHHAELPRIMGLGGEAAKLPGPSLVRRLCSLAGLGGRVCEMGVQVMLLEPFRPRPRPGIQRAGPAVCWVCSALAGRVRGRSALADTASGLEGGGPGRAGRVAAARQPLGLSCPLAGQHGPARLLALSSLPGDTSGSGPGAPGAGRRAAVADRRGRRAASDGRERAHAPTRRLARPFRLLCRGGRRPHPGQPPGSLAPPSPAKAVRSRLSPGPSHSSLPKLAWPGAAVHRRERRVRVDGCMGACVPLAHVLVPRHVCRHEAATCALSSAGLVCPLDGNVQWNPVLPAVGPVSGSPGSKALTRSLEGC